MADSLVFDSVFKTMIHKSPQLLVPFINEAFGRNYPPDAAIVQFSTEHEELQGSVIADSVFRLQDKIYHVECQSTPDTDMVVRMIEYDFAIALEGALNAGAPYEMNFPESCVLFLRHTSNTPDELTIKVNLPNGESFNYESKVVKAQKYTSDELFEKRLLLLIPYYLMRYEKALGDIASDDARSAQLVAECAELRARLEAVAVAEDQPLLYEQLTELIMRVVDRLMAAHDLLHEKVRRVMGGEVLELLTDRLERAEQMERDARERGIAQGLEEGLQQGREQGLELGLAQGLEQGRAQGLEQGRAQGLEQGRAQGLEQGRNEGIEALAERLRELGVDERVVAEAVAASREDES